MAVVTWAVGAGAARSPFIFDVDWSLMGSGRSYRTAHVHHGNGKGKQCVFGNHFFLKKFNTIIKDNKLQVREIQEFRRRTN